MIAFQPVAATDFPVIRIWLERPHVKLWWRDGVDQDIAEITAALDDREPTDYYLIVAGGRPVGLIQTYLVADYPDWGAVIGVTGDENVAGVDLLIGELDLIGVGLGPRVLAAFAADVVFAREDIVACVATVEEPNRRSWRAFEKAGFRHVRDLEEEGLPHRLLRFDRPTA